MEIRLSENAAQFFKSEFDPPQGKGIRIKGKVYGKTNVHDNFSVAIEIAVPKDPIASTEVDGVTVFGEKEDEWFLAGYDLEIDYQEGDDAPTYFFVSEDPKIAAQQKADGYSTASTKSSDCSL